MASTARNPERAGSGLREHDRRETDHREDIPVAPAIQARWVGEASCHFEDAFRSLAKAVIRLGEAGLEPTDDLAEVIEDVGDIASGMTALADQLAAGKSQ